MIVQIIPAKRVPLSLPFLDYIVPEPYRDTIQIGQLVKIPFRNKEEFGVVFNLESSAANKNLKLKPITEIVFKKPILSKAQLNFLADISEFYHVSLGFLLKNNLIPLQKRKLQKLQSENSSPDTSLTLFTKQTRHKPELFVYNNAEEKTNVILEKLKHADSQILFLVPELKSVEKIKAILPNNILKKTTVITSELNEKELFTRWLEIWRGEKNIIIGTRAALFLPWFNLQHIILDDEGNSNYKSWDMAPRLHTRDAALFLSTSHGAELTLLSHTPTVETLFFAQKKVYAGGHIDVKPIRKEIQIVDMRAQRRLKNFSLMSHDLLEAFQKIKTGDIFLFINRRGTLSYVGCQDCGNVLKCPNCHFSLTYHQDTGRLSCHFCQYSEHMSLECKKCQGTNINMFGAGTQLAEELIKKIVPKNDTRPIIRIDSDETDLKKLDTEADPGTRSAGAAQYGAGKIIIGTQLAWTRLDWSKIKLLAFLDADSSLFIPEYKISENLWQQLRDAQFNLPADSQLVVQTSHPEHLVFTSLFDPQAFYAQQFEERQVLGYPPFKFLVKITNGNSKEQILKAETAKVMAQLAHLTKNSADITIMGPWETSPYRHNGQYSQLLLAKIKYNNYKKNTKLLLSHIPDNWKIDPNPNSILSFS